MTHLVTHDDDDGSLRCIYTSTLAYIVDANTGRSSSAVAMNSAFRGIAAFVGAEVAVPLQVCEMLRAPHRHITIGMR